MLRVFTLIALILLAPWACKDGPGSKAKDAQDLITGSDKNKEESDGQDQTAKQSQNAAPSVAYCTGSGSADNPKQALDALYKRLPERLAVEFLEYKQRFRMSGNSEALSKTCAAAVAGPAKTLDKELKTRALNLDSCWLAEAPKDGETPLPFVYLLESTDTINQSLIPMAVYAYVEFYLDFILLPKVASIPASEARLKQDLDEFSPMRSKLAEALVNDLVAGNHSKTLEIYRQRFQVEKVEQLSENIAFQNFALAETAEAMWCSESSANDMERLKLTRTKAAFAWFDEFFSRPLMAETTPKEDDKVDDQSGTAAGDTAGTGATSNVGGETTDDVVEPGAP